MESTNYYLSLRTTLNYSKSVSNETLINIVDIQSLDQSRMQFQSLSLLYKCLYNQGALSILVDFLV